MISNENIKSQKYLITSYSRIVKTSSNSSNNFEVLLSIILNAQII